MVENRYNKCYLGIQPKETYDAKEERIHRRKQLQGQEEQAGKEGDKHEAERCDSEGREAEEEVGDE